MDTIGRHVPLFRKMALNIQVTKKECGDIPETLLDTYEPDRYVLSPWGEIFWQRFREEHYGRVFITEPPLPERIRFEESFLDDVRQFANDAQKLAELNERIDDLAHYLINGNCLKRLNFKKLEGKPVPGCTHEFYAWSTGGAWRCFCAFDEEKKVCRIKKLDKHL
jgi:hypothetical protein